jgi:hypothetical protein
MKHQHNKKVHKSILVDFSIHKHATLIHFLKYFANEK